MDGYTVATINTKFLGFAGFLAAFIALVMIGGIWFGSTWIASPWFWLIAFSCLAASIICLIVWRIDSAYSGVELEPGDLVDEDESELKSGAPRPAPRSAAAAIARAKQPMKLAGVIQKPVAKQPATQPRPSPVGQPAAPQKAVADTKAAAAGEPKPTAKAIAFLPTAPAAKPTSPRKDDDAGARLASQFASISPEEAEEPEKVEKEDAVDDAATGPVQKIKLNRKNVQLLIQIYREEGYHYVSFSKVRREMGVGKGKEALKLKKLMLEAVAMGFLAKKGSKYIIQREGQGPLR